MIESFMKLPEDKRNVIIKSGMKAFTECGYALANTIEIAKECGIAKGSLFHYFKSKKGFYIFIVRHCAELILQETEQGVSRIKGTDYFERIRKNVLQKIALPLRFPAETAFLSRAFSENAYETAEDLRKISIEYAGRIRELNSKYIGLPDRKDIREDIEYQEACSYIQTVFDAVTARMLKQYATRQEELLSNTDIIMNELNKTMYFLMNGIGRGREI